MRKLEENVQRPCTNLNSVFLLIIDTVRRMYNEQTSQESRYTDSLKLSNMDRLEINYYGVRINYPCALCGPFHVDSSKSMLLFKELREGL